jgi:hypothetical protein
MNYIIADRDYPRFKNDGVANIFAMRFHMDY